MEWRFCRILLSRTGPGGICQTVHSMIRPHLVLLHTLSSYYQFLLPGSPAGESSPWCLFWPPFLSVDWTPTNRSVCNIANGTTGVQSDYILQTTSRAEFAMTNKLDIHIETQVYALHSTILYISNPFEVDDSNHTPNELNIPAGYWYLTNTGPG